MHVEELGLKGLRKITLKGFPDERGFFLERFRAESFAALGLPAFQQDNFSRSKPGVLRGLHYQFDLPQAKLVSCLRGRIYDVAVDLRHDSPTFGKHAGVELRGDTWTWLWVPVGFAHGFAVLGDEEADVLYKVDNYWNPKGEAGLVWNDPDLKIQWPEVELILSEKDRKLGSFADYRLKPRF